jgi:hypothetical protein
MLAIVTVKVGKNPSHDKLHKRTGPDPFTFICTDYTGEDHSLLVWGKDELEIAGKVHGEGYQIERLEVVNHVLGLTEGDLKKSFLDLSK